MTTNETLDLHRPTAEFRDYLEGEVIREYRQRRTFRRLRAAEIRGERTPWCKRTTGDRL